MAAPKTLEELAALASITVGDLKEFKEADFEELTKELGIPVTAKVKLRGLHRELLESCAEGGGGADGAGGVEAAGGGSGAAAGVVQQQPQQGTRVAAGLDALAPLDSLAARFRPLVAKPPADFLDTIKPIEEAAIIPDVMRFAEATLQNARDAKQFGDLKDDPLCIQGIAYIMKYSAEDTQPTFYGDMNNKCYLKDRKNIDPYGLYVVNLVMQMKHVEVYPNGNVYRGVKADLRADYPEDREFTWHGFCSTTKSIAVTNAFIGQSGKR